MNLTTLDDLLHYTAAGLLTRDDVLAILRHERCNADEETLADALQHLRQRDDLIQMYGCPSAYLGADPHAGVRLHELVVSHAEANYAWRVRVLLGEVVDA